MRQGTGRAMRPHRWYILALAALAASASLVDARAEGEFVLRMVGRAEGSGFTAHHNALQAAKQEVIWEILKSKVASGHSLRPYRVMARNADAYIDRVAELHVDTDGGLTRVEIDAYVNIHALEQDLASTAKPRLAKPPVISCLIGEEDPNGLISIDGNGLTEKALVDGLKKLELDARGHRESTVQYSDADLHAVLTGDVDRAAAYARETLADAAVVGIVRLQREADQDQGGTAKTRATLEVRVFRGSDGDLLEVFARSAAIIGNDAEACREEAASDVADKLLGDITVTTVLSVLSSQKQDEVLITLLNPGTEERIRLLLGLLEQDPAVHSVQEAYFSERSARVRVGYDGPMSYLVDLIRDKSYDGWVIEIQEVIDREMNLIMVPMEKATQ